MMRFTTLNLGWFVTYQKITVMPGHAGTQDPLVTVTRQAVYFPATLMSHAALILPSLLQFSNLKALRIPIPYLRFSQAAQDLQMLFL